MDRSDLAGQIDRVILEVAAAEQRAVITNNVKDFRPLAAERLARGESHAGLILLPSTRTRTRDAVEMLTDAIDRVLREHPAGLPATERWVHRAFELRIRATAVGRQRHAIGQSVPEGESRASQRLRTRLSSAIGASFAAVHLRPRARRSSGSRSRRGVRGGRRPRRRSRPRAMRARRQCAGRSASTGASRAAPASACPRRPLRGGSERRISFGVHGSPLRFAESPRHIALLQGRPYLPRTPKLSGAVASCPARLCWASTSASSRGIGTVRADPSVLVGRRLTCRSTCTSSSRPRHRRQRRCGHRPGQPAQLRDPGARQPRR